MTLRRKPLLSPLGYLTDQPRTFGIFTRLAF